MLMILYTIAAWTITPIALEFINTRIAGNDKIQNVVKSWPAFALNLIICVGVAFVITLLPRGWPFTFSSWFLLTCVIHFGNQLFFHSIVKPLVSYRS